jgi:hypothetical protein
LGEWVHRFYGVLEALFMQTTAAASQLTLDASDQQGFYAPMHIHPCTFTRQDIR